ncbi:MAG TPA: dTDP-4-dehydrorhamnose 3,5-epimerase [Longimicrobiales bacterium]|nr:dTDP-4-dehydrorhamnose 3,5-epimerase [Longimicrobiales bacterium]
MSAHVTELALSGVLLFEPRVFSDDRGSFVEFWNQARAREMGFDEQFVQDNIATSKQRVLRGMHFQHPNPQGKYVTAAHGRIYDVVVDLRTNSPTVGKWVATELSVESGEVLYVPPGFAHGYQVLSSEATVIYKCTELYRAENDRTIAWNDPALGIQWPLADPILSQKDANAPSFADVRAQCGF